MLQQWFTWWIHNSIQKDQSNPFYESMSTWTKKTKIIVTSSFLSTSPILHLKAKTPKPNSDSYKEKNYRMKRLISKTLISSLLASTTTPSSKQSVKLSRKRFLVQRMFAGFSILLLITQKSNKFTCLIYQPNYILRTAVNSWLKKESTRDMKFVLKLWTSSSKWQFYTAKTSRMMKHIPHRRWNWATIQKTQRNSSWWRY